MNGDTWSRTELEWTLGNDLHDILHIADKLFLR